MYKPAKSGNNDNSQKIRKYLSHAGSFGHHHHGGCVQIRKYINLRVEESHNPGSQNKKTEDYDKNSIVKRKPYYLVKHNDTPGLMVMGVSGRRDCGGLSHSHH